jgi:hypothetical protein
MNLFSSGYKLLQNRKVSTDNLGISTFQKLKGKRGSMTKNIKEKRSCLKKRTTYLFWRCSGHPRLIDL